MNRCIVFAGEIKGQLKAKILLPKEEALKYAKELEETHKLVAVCQLNGKPVADTIYTNFDLED